MDDGRNDVVGKSDGVPDVDGKKLRDGEADGASETLGGNINGAGAADPAPVPVTVAALTRISPMLGMASIMVGIVDNSRRASRSSFWTSAMAGTGSAKLHVPSNAIGAFLSCRCRRKLSSSERKSRMTLSGRESLTENQKARYSSTTILSALASCNSPSYCKENERSGTLLKLNSLGSFSFGRSPLVRFVVADQAT